MRRMEKMMRVGAVVFDQSLEGGAVGFPEFMPHRMSFFFAQIKFTPDVFRHFAVQVREDVRLGVVQGIVEVEDPGGWFFQLFADAVKDKLFRLLGS